MVKITEAILTILLKTQSHIIYGHHKLYIELKNKMSVSNFEFFLLMDGRIICDCNIYAIY